MALYHSLSSVLLIPVCLSLSLSVGLPPSAAKKKKNIVRLHLTSRLLSCAFVLLWMIMVLKRKCPSHCILLLVFVSFVFVYGCLFWNMAFFFNCLQHIIQFPAVFFCFLFFNFDVCIWFVFFLMILRGMLVGGSDVFSVRTSGGPS